MSTESGYEQIWDGLVTAALLGTNRRQAPSIPPGILADLVDDALRPDPGLRMLDTVAAVAGARRAAFKPRPAALALQSPPVDRRPLVPIDAVAEWRVATSQWRILEDEWILAVIDRGWQLPPDVLVALLQRTTGDAIRRARVMRAAGQPGEWLSTQFPAMALTARGHPPDDDPLELPTLPIPPELDELRELDALSFTRAITTGFLAGQFASSHRPVLINLFARCRPGVLVDSAEALSRLNDGLAHSMAQLCNSRHRMLATLT